MRRRDVLVDKPEGWEREGEREPAGDAPADDAGEVFDEGEGAGTSLLGVGSGARRRDDFARVFTTNFTTNHLIDRVRQSIGVIINRSISDSESPGLCESRSNSSAMARRST